MTAGIEGVGEAVTGSMLARAVEPAAGEHGESEPGNCLNCGAALQGAYCHLCGQPGHIHRSLAAFWHDLAHGVLHFEGKIWRTLPMLAWRPGELTRRYIEGERARFVSPMALFLFSVFLMFAVFSLIGGPFAFRGGDSAGDLSPAGQRAAVEERFHAQQAAARQRLDALRARRADRVAHGRDPAVIDANIRSTEEGARLQQQIFAQTVAMIQAAEQRQRNEAPAGQAAGADDNERVDVNVSGPRSNIEWVNEAWRNAKRNPELLAFRLQTNAYKFSWALIPISVPLLWLLFLHRRRYRRYKAFDHTVFVTYSIAFMSLGLVALSLLRPLGVGDTIIGLAILLVPPVHIYRQLRGAYSLSRFSALWRTILLLWLALIAATIFFLLLVVLGALE